MKYKPCVCVREKGSAKLSADRIYWAVGTKNICFAAVSILAAVWFMSYAAECVDAIAARALVLSIRNLISRMYLRQVGYFAISPSAYSAVRSSRSLMWRWRSDRKCCRHDKDIGPVWEWMIVIQDDNSIPFRCCIRNDNNRRSRGRRQVSWWSG